jgi:pantetheine-phosphate adenylyltransferase
MKVIVPGSYDPITLGHLEVIRRAAKEYGDVYAVMFVNPNKTYTFTVAERLKMIELATEDVGKVHVGFSRGLVVDYMRENGIERIVKGYRTEADLPWEREQAEWNFAHGGYETELWKCDCEFEAVSSTAVREALKRGEDDVASSLLHPKVYEYICSLKK